ncbi:MAG TPA: MFS transporter [Ramlibacter sp.]|nr:MFS transporter [Ramlibacter sp.]
MEFRMKNPLHPALAHAGSFRTLSHGRALWLQGLLLVSFLAASSVPSPLYAIYRSIWGFSPLMLTVVFASYAIALLLALVVFGGLSDFRGRREVIVGAVLLEMLALVLFWQADSVGWLLAARIVQGVATGIATSAIGAGLLDLHRERGPLINSVAPMVGLGVGALAAGLLVQFAPAPTRLVFDVLLLVFALQLVAAFFLPETAARRPGALRSLAPLIAIPLQARPTLRRVLPVNTAQWALGGFYFSLGPTLARAVTGNDSALVGGVLLGVLALASASAVALGRHLPPRRTVRLGAAGLVLGVLGTLAGVHWSWAAVALGGTVVSGTGFGLAFSGSLRSLVPLAQPHQRASLMAAFLVASYLAFSIPAIVAGLLTSHFGLHTTALAYGLGVAVLAAAALAASPGPASAPAARKALDGGPGGAGEVRP